MAKWDGLRERLVYVDDQVTLRWSEIEALVGGLPPSAYNHRAFWGGDRRQWAGFRTTDVRVGDRVTFVRVGTPATVRPRSQPSAPDRTVSRPDAVLVGCVKSKRAEPSPAKDLYTSALFRKERAHAEASNAPWFILSAEHGLIHPDSLLAPYDRYLAGESSAYRDAWGERVVEQLANELGSLTGLTLEVHAGSSYVDAVRGPLERAGARVLDPLHGLTLGQRLAWYPATTAVEWAQARTAVDASDVLDTLTNPEAGRLPRDVLAHRDPSWNSPGLYSWWVDTEGAADLTAGLGHRIAPGLIYAGLAGATRAVSGRKSNNTLWGRIAGMHLGGRHEFSTFRRTLGAILAEARNDPTINEDALTAWMHKHLRVNAVPVEDADTLDALETEVLTRLDPPLNLAKMPRTPVRTRLTELRRPHASQR